MVRHISKLNVKAFRGIKNLCLDDLSLINILVGSNNCGKTSLLEAIKIMENPEDLGSILRVASGRRTMNNDNFLRVANSIFQDTGEEFCIDIQADINNVNFELRVVAENKSILNIGTGEDDGTDVIESNNRGLEGRLLVLENGKKINKKNTFSIYNYSTVKIDESKKNFKSIYVHSNVNYYTSCVKFIKDNIVNNTFKKDTLIQMIRIFDTSINDISIIDSEIYLHDNENNSKPLFSYGNGTQKAVLLAAVMAQCEDGVMLIDEIDNAIHKTALKDIFQNFISACKEMNIQTFITTHSIEALDIMLEVNENMSSDSIRVITLKKDVQNTVARVLTGAEAINVRDEYNLELR